MNLSDSRAILIVDDHHIVREGVRSVLETLRPGWKISEAANGAQAIEAVRAKTPDLVIMDVTMPDATGFEVTSRLRESGFVPPILMFTMHQSQRLAMDVREAGGQGYVLKSQATDDLVRAIDIVLGGGTFFEGTPSPETPLADPTLGNLMIFFSRGFTLDFA